MPQFLYEAGYGCPAFLERSGAIGVTQPRRVAAVSTAARVAEELGGAVGETVGYQVCNAECEILFVAFLVCCCGVSCCGQTLLQCTNLIVARCTGGSNLESIAQSAEMVLACAVSARRSKC